MATPCAPDGAAVCATHATHATHYSSPVRMRRQLNERPTRLRQLIQVERVLGETHHPAFQLMLLVLCGLCLVIDGFDAQAMGYVAPSVIGESACVEGGTRPGVQRKPVRHAAGGAGAVGAGRPDRQAAGADWRDAVLRAGNAGYATRHDDPRVAHAALHHGPRAWLHHAERDGAGRRILEHRAPRQTDDAGVVRLHARRGAGGLYQRGADSVLRLACGVLGRRHGALAARLRDARKAAGIAAISGAQGPGRARLALARPL